MRGAAASPSEGPNFVEDTKEALLQDAFINHCETKTHALTQKQLCDRWA